mgnify:CR=1 FL=1
MTLWVDDREPIQIIQGLREKGIDVKVKRIESGDYVFNKFAIERKSIQDLLSSLNSKRYWSQIETLKNTYEYPMVLIEGDLDVATKKTYYKGRLFEIKLSDQDYRNIRRTKIATLLGWKIPIIETKDYEETVDWIVDMYERERYHESKVPPPAVKKSLKPEEIRINMLCCIHGIGPYLAKKILEKFTMRDLIEKDPREVSKAIRGVSLGLARVLKESLGGE